MASRLPHQLPLSQNATPKVTLLPEPPEQLFPSLEIIKEGIELWARQYFFTVIFGRSKKDPQNKIYR